MTRDEKKAKDRWEYVSDRLCNSDYPIYNEEHELESAFDAGVKWADQNPDSSWATRLKLEKEELLEKACEWLGTALYLDYERNIQHRYASLEELINDFRKAMKGD